MLKESENLNEWKPLRSLFETPYTVKMEIFSKLIYGVYKIPIRNQTNFCVEIEKLIAKFIWNSKGLRLAKTILKTKNKVGGLTLLDFKPITKQQ